MWLRLALLILLGIVAYALLACGPEGKFIPSGGGATIWTPAPCQSDACREKPPIKQEIDRKTPRNPNFVLEIEHEKCQDGEGFVLVLDQNKAQVVEDKEENGKRITNLYIPEMNGSLAFEAGCKFSSIDVYISIKPKYWADGEIQIPYPHGFKIFASDHPEKMVSGLTEEYINSFGDQQSIKERPLREDGSWLFWGVIPPGKKLHIEIRSPN